MHSSSRPDQLPPRFAPGRALALQPWLRALTLLLAVSHMPGCALLVVGGVAAGATAIYDRRPTEVVVDDERIELSAVGAFMNDPAVNGHGRISATSYNYNVLLTGQADTAEAAARATELTSALPKVRRVIDEITIGPTSSFSRESEDAYVTSRAKLALVEVDVPGFDASRVKVVTEDGVVYLMGLVSPEEGDAAAEKVRYVSGVKRVVKLFEYNEKPS